jgi:hypothetical protein
MATRFLGAGYPVCGEARSKDKAQELLDVERRLNVLVS